MHGPQVPIIASNRVGKEEFSGSAVTYYGGSFISGNQGDIIKQVGSGQMWARAR